MTVSLKNRIYLSFLLLVLLFVVNGVITIVNINYNKNLNTHISEVVDPSLQTMDEIKEMLVHSKMYATNWVFLRSEQDDKDDLIKLHNTVYPKLKSRMLAHSSQWANKNWIDSLNKVYTGFEQLIVTEKEIMGALQKFEDYDDPMNKLGAEEQLEDIVLPKTAELMTTLNNVILFGQKIKLEENRDIEDMSKRLRIQIIFLVITIIAIGAFLAVYMAGRIITPLNKIRHIINDLGKGVINKVDHKENRDEIGEMVQSVNNLTEKLEATATFAHEVGNRNYDIPFKPLSNEDILGKALITMRDNIKSSDALLNEAQQLAKVGNWNYNTKTYKLFWSDGLKEIYGLDKDFVPDFEYYKSLIHPDDQEKMLRQMGIVQEHGDSMETYFRIIQPGGAIRILKGKTNAEMDENGYPIRLYGVVQDVTELKTAQDELEATLKELEERVEERTRDLSITNDVLRSEIHERVRMGKELEEKNKDITDSILYAERLQNAIVPDVRILHKNFNRFFVFNRQKNIVGGDFYWFHKNRQNYMIACADCTGHGVPGAFLSIMGIDLLNKMIIDQQWKYPSLVLEMMDDGLNKILGGEKTDRVHDGMDISFCVINKIEKKIQFAGAMNPVIVVSDGEVTVYKENRFALGAYMDLSKKRFETIEISYKEGDMLYMFTDGYLDQFGGPKNRKFMMPNLKKLFIKMHLLSGAEQKQLLEKEFDEWKGSNEQTDDVMVLGIGL